jgi:hypothetical protein
VTRRPGGDAPFDCLARRRHLSPRQARGPLRRPGVPPLTAQRHAGQSATPCLGLVIRDCRPQLGRGCWPVKGCAPGGAAAHRVEGRGAEATRPTGKRRPRKRHRAPQGFHGTLDVVARLQEPITRGTGGLLAGVCAAMGRLHNGLAQAAGALWAALPPGLSPRGSGRRWLVYVYLPPLEPRIEAGMALLAQAVPLFSGAHLG